MIRERFQPGKQRHKAWMTKAINFRVKTPARIAPRRIVGYRFPQGFEAVGKLPQ